MHDFYYKKRQLYCEQVPIVKIAEELGTPCYVYSKKTILDHFRKLKAAFRPVNPLICFSMKANSNLAICSLLVKEGAGLDIVSGGELFRAKQVGVDPRKIVYASVGKTPNEIADAIGHGILFFNVESIPELEMMNAIAGRQNKMAEVCIRVNPDIDPKTHMFITTGHKENKFGLDFETVRQIFRSQQKYPHVKIRGLHVHIGSQITQARPFITALGKVIRFIAALKKEGVRLAYLNIGGGLGIIYKDERPQTAQAFAVKILPLLKATGLRIILEPGRFIVGNSGILVAKVVYVKQTKVKHFVVVDAGMNDLIRPCLYHAYHEILPLQQMPGKKKKICDVVGPICESSDYLAKNYVLPEMEQGALLACMSAGAYGFSMASNYNSRRRPCEVMVDKDTYYVIRERETYQDLVRHERIFPKR